MASARALGGAIPTSRTTYIGKGRGRGRGAAAGDGSPRQPGSQAGSAGTDQRQLLGVAGILELLETAPPSTNAESLAEQVFKEAEASINTGDEVTKFAHSLYKWTLQAPDRAKNAAIACNAVGQLERDNIKFRSPFLQTLKKDYDSRNEWKDVEETRWVSLACLVCQFYKEFRVAGNYVAALESPALTCIEMLLSTSSIKCHVYGIEQLCDLGPILYPKNSEKIDEMMDDLRRRLLASDTLSSSRVLFLEALEFYAGGWEMDETAVDYYTNKKAGI
ncbi:MIF4G domain-containing protein A-like [Amphiura filiformis]|uniref:MIF4G domain-containing protein A-like n=1 Tax=Amphiura filiformis TaxID=82378 RepID=UPI003B2204A3